MIRSLFRAGRAAAVPFLLFGVGCAEQLTFEEVRIASVTGVSSTLSAAAGATVPVSVRVLDQRGRGVPGQSVTFSASAGTLNPASATTNQDGVATSQWTAGTVSGARTVNVAVPTAAGVAAALPATVVPAAPATATLSRGNVTFDAVTDTVRYAVSAVADAFGNAIGGTTAIVWVSSDTTVARVSATGLVESRANGTATISTRVGTTTLASASVTVAQAPVQVTLTPGRSRVVAVNDTLRLSVTARDRLNQVIPNAASLFTYASSNASSVAVPQGTVPLVRAAGTGRATITATRGALTASVLVAAGAAVATRVVASPDSIQRFSSARSVLITAQTLDQDTIPMTGRTFTFTSSATSVATVTSAGNATSVASGLAGIVVADGTAAPDTVPFRVQQVVASVAAADSVQLAQSDTVALTPTARDSAGAAIAGVTFTYGSSATGTATVSAAGRVVGVANGTATVTISVGSVSRAVPVRVLGATLWRELQVTANVGCGITTGNELYCFGNDAWGMGGFSSARRDSFAIRPTRPQGTSALRFTGLALNGGTACALAIDGQVYCSGQGSRGALAVNPNTLQRLNESWCPGTVGCEFRSQFLAVATPIRFTKIVANRGGFCGIDTSARVACWGENYGRQLGVPNLGADTMIVTPRFITDTTTFRDITGTNDTMCGIAIRNNATVCWGGPAWGVKGASAPGATPAASFTETVATVPGVPVFDRFARVGQGYTGPLCGITAGGELWCWGYNGWAQQGKAANTTANAPARVTLPGPVADASLGGLHACAILTNGELYCWGSNANRELALESGTAVCTGGGTDPIAGSNEITATVSCVPTPTRVVPSLTFARVTTFSNAFSFRDGNIGAATCALRASGTAYCWGGGVWREGAQFPAGGTATPYLIGPPTN